MASPDPSGNIPIPTSNVVEDSALDAGTPSASNRPPGTASGDAINVSFSQRSFQRPGQDIPYTHAITSGARVTRDEESLLDTASDRPPIPSALPAGGPEAAYSTPLPVLPLMVLSITMLSEFLSASVCIPFLFFMVEGFLAHDKKADVGSWTGVLVSTFSLTQFLTSLLWTTVAERHGERTVLFVSLLGSSLTCVAFGTSTSFPEALAIRLMQGVFAGSIGVARSSIGNITDGSNEGRAYAILGFCWGFGGSVGAIIGGTFESPAKKWPGVFAKIPLFVRYPYLFPCIIAGSISLTGAILSLFLARDGGSREGAIYLPTVKEETEPAEETRQDVVSGGDLITDDNASSGATLQRLRENLSKRYSSLFAGRVADAHVESSSGDPVPPSPSTPIPQKISRTVASRTSRVNGSAYGYGGYHTRLASNAATLRRRSIGSTLRRRRGTIGESVGTDGIGTPHEASNFAERLLMANENAVTNIADLWVAAAINVDYDEMFMSDEEELEGFLDDELEGGETSQNGGDIHRTFAASSAASRNPLDLTGTATPEPATSRNLLELQRALTAGSAASQNTSLRWRRDPTVMRFTSSAHPPSPVPGRPVSGQYSTPTRARLSTLEPGLRDSYHETSYAAGSQRRSRMPRPLSSASLLPSIYANSGVRTPPGLLVDPAVQLQAAVEREDPPVDGLDATPEGRRNSLLHSEKPQSAFKQLPLMIILQYGLLSLHSTTNDQIFLSYLVSKYDSGGLGLTAAHFSQIIALMCLAQIAYQFYLYPNIGPPRGRFSHLAMFRLGSLLFIPAYISVTWYRAFASKAEDGNLIIMTLLTISTAIRFCGLTFSYTAISILLNYMSPPQVVGLANGLAQSIVCLARFVGPILGGAIWSMSIKDDPGGYSLGFLICSGVCALAILHSFMIR